MGNANCDLNSCFLFSHGACRDKSSSLQHPHSPSDHFQTSKILFFLGSKKDHPMHDFLPLCLFGTSRSACYREHKKEVIDEFYYNGNGVWIGCTAVIEVGEWKTN